MPRSRGVGGIGMHVGSIAAGLEEGEAYGVLTGEEGAASEPAAVAGDPVTVTVVLYVEVMR
jgi:hypothetical protein